MSSIKLTADSGGGTFELKAPASSGNTRSFTLPDVATGLGGILEVDHWYLPSNWYTSGAIITSWARFTQANVSAASPLGTVMSHSSGTFTSPSIGDATSTTGLTVNPETSKTIIQSTFANVKSGAWSGSTPTYRLNPRKTNITTNQWTATDGSNTPPNNPGQTRTTFWTGNLVRRKFFGGGTQ